MSWRNIKPRSYEKYGLFNLQDPLSLERCIIYCEPEWEDFFEIQEFVSKESFVFKVSTCGNEERRPPNYPASCHFMQMSNEPYLVPPRVIDRKVL